MIFPYLVRHNGVDYAPGVNVPIDEEKEVNHVNAEHEIPQPDFEYTKSQVNRLSTAELQALAAKYGIDSDKTGSELKKILIAKFEL